MAGVLPSRNNCSVPVLCSQFAKCISHYIHCTSSSLLSEVLGIIWRDFTSVCSLDMDKLFQLLHYINRIRRTASLSVTDKRSGMSLSGFYLHVQ